MPHGVVSKLKARCPDCEEVIKPHSKVRLGQRIFCPECGTELVVVGLNPLEFDWAIDDDDEDFDDFDDDDDWD